MDHEKEPSKRDEGSAEDEKQTTTRGGRHAKPQAGRKPDGGSEQDAACGGMFGQSPIDRSRHLGHCAPSARVCGPPGIITAYRSPGMRDRSSSTLRSCSSLSTSKIGDSECSTMYRTCSGEQVV